MATLEENWHCISDMGQQMRQLAANEDWSNIAELAQSRHQLVTEHFQCFPVGPSNAEFYKLHINHFFQQEQILTDLVDSARKNVLRDVSHVSHNRRAINAYQKVIDPSRSA